MLATGLLPLWFLSCVDTQKHPGLRGALIYTTIGKEPFQDSAFLLNLQTLKSRVFLKGKSPRSYTAVSARSVTGLMVVATRELGPAQNAVKDRLYVYAPERQTWDPVNTFAPSSFEGDGMLGADNHTIVLTLADPATPGSYEVWWADRTSGVHRKLTTVRLGSWDVFPESRSDGQEVLFLRFTQTSKGLLSTLLAVPSIGGSEKLLLAESEGASSAGYSPDGTRIAVWTRNGLEILNEADESRKLVLPLSKISGFNLSSARISWSGLHDRIVFPLVNRRTGRYGIWWVSPEGQDFTQLYDGTDSQIGSISIVPSTGS